ncbi:hypothetical protein MTR67_023221, partial [Solanum verrucosum]
IGAPADNSTSLVGIADQLGDSPFGVVHRHLTPAFNIIVLWSLADMVLLSGTSWRCTDCSVFPPT